MALPSVDITPATHLKPLDKLHREVDRIFSDFNEALGFRPLALDQADYAFRPHAELHESDATTTIRVELPGVDQKDIEISVTDDTIEIAGEKKSETETKDGDRYRSERTFGSFYRAFSLPFTIDSSKVEASFDNGVLTVKVPSPAPSESKAKRIAIKS